MCLFVPHTATPDPFVSSPTLFELSAQQRDANPPWFSLAFNVTPAPPTFVTCQNDGNQVDVVYLSREVGAGVYQTEGATVVSATETEVTVTVVTREAGGYQCNVSVFRSSGDMLSNAVSMPLIISGLCISFCL